MARTKKAAQAEKKSSKRNEKSSDDEEEDIMAEDGPPSIDPYEVLGLETEATADDVKKAYRKLALKHHPDKAAESDKEDAHKKFQEIAFAYAVLSDDRRRKRYDLTGSTAETLEGDDDFDWLNFYRGQFEDIVTEESINRISKEFKGSDEEKEQLLDAYTKYKGNLSHVYESVMLADILVDDDRFRQIIDEAIANNEVDSFPKYEKENDETRKKAKDAERKRREAFDKEQELEQAEAGTSKGKPNGKAKTQSKEQSGGDLNDLAAMIQQRQKSRAGNFFDHLEAKYAPTGRGSKRSTPMDEPPEELFAANRSKKSKTTSRAKKAKADEEDEDMDLSSEDVGESDEEEDEAPRKSKPKAKAKGRGRAKGKA